MQTLNFRFSISMEENQVKPINMEENQVKPINMEENQVKEEEERQRMKAEGGEEWLFDLNEFSALLCQLDAVATQVGNLHCILI